MRSDGGNDSMFGFLVGAACVAGLFRVMRRRRGDYGWHGCGDHRHHSHHGHHSGGWDGGRGPWGRGGDDGGSRTPWWLRGLFSRLDTTPGQEKVIREVMNELRDEGRDLRGEFRKARGDLAGALRSEGVDETALGEAFARHDDALLRMRKGVVGALAKLHEALDERQRRVLADWLESSRGFGGGARDRDEDERGMA
ncbi:MAG: periplasmic heavy metal sensor [Deltaproteobacteria bacterium]|nr:periplasmic heavy metal sensor [Deltaproteobacteria bacterium]MBK8714847.1 periplasmic heavy metal sensor [Deltaproteobacteria bacterium]MBP7287380.1 periplasmic heavy metal sensor [Nannocystaceae bacterium]